MSRKMRHIRGALLEVSSQRVTYKPYGYTLGFGQGEADTILVEFEIPEDAVLTPGNERIVIGLEGLKAILSVTADAIDELNQEYLKKLQEEE